MTMFERQWYCAAAARQRPVTAALGRMLLLPAIGAMLLLSGCESTPSTRRQAAATRPVLRLTQQVGGTHYRTLVIGDAWLQTFGSDLLILEPTSGRVLRTIHLARIGESGAAIDMIAVGDRLYVVMDSDEVVELDISEPQRPRELARRTSAELRITPKRLSAVDDEVYISGVGGVVRWSDNQRLYRHGGDAGRVVSSDEGLVTTIGRRIYRIEDGRFVGSASDMRPARGFDASGLPHDDNELLIFSRQSEQGALIGLLGPNLRELDSRRLTVAIPGQVRSMRVLDGRICAVTDAEISIYEVHDGRLVRSMFIDVLGARDAARLDENHLAVAGSFGRAMYRIESSERGPGDTFLQVHREPSRLSQAKSDGRYILAGSDESAWLYLIGSRVELSQEPLDRGGAPPPPTTSATAVGARARISEDGSILTVTTERGVMEYAEPSGAALHCVTSVEGEFWLGHDRGITVLQPRASERAEPRGDEGGAEILVRGSLRLDGPVRYLFPLRVGRGVAFVSEFGGFGTAQWIDEPIE